MNEAHNEFVGGVTYTDSFTVATADGTTQVVTVSILGTNDAAVISGTRRRRGRKPTRSRSAWGTLDASDVDSSADFVAQSGVAGEWLRHVRDRRERGVDLHDRTRPTTSSLAV